MSKYHLSDEKKYILSLQQGSEVAFEVLYRRYQSKLFIYCFGFVKSRDIADDLVQDIFLKIWLKRSLLNPTHSFGAFLFKIAKNAILDYFRHQSAESSFFESFYHRVELLHHQSEEDIIYADLKKIAEAVIEKLPEQRQKIFKMSREEGMSYDEIAQTLSISPNTVKEQIARSLKFIREQLMLQTDLSLVLILMILYL